MRHDFSTLRRVRTAAFALGLPFSVVIFLATGAEASLTISSKPTGNVVCTDGVCTATASRANLNAGDLETMLASGSVDVSTGGSVATNIIVDAALSWANSSMLTFDAYQSLTVNDPVSVAGTGALAILTNDGGSGGELSFGRQGDVSFLGLSNSLTINGASYTLVDDIGTLASDIASNPNANYAIAGTFDAAKEASYPETPITTTFGGTLEGLGNTIKRLLIRNADRAHNSLAMFAALASSATVENINFTQAQISGYEYVSKTPIIMATLAINSAGQIRNVSLAGTVQIATGGSPWEAAGLVWSNSGTIANVNANVTVNVNIDGTASECDPGRGDYCNAGGLVGVSSGTIASSHVAGNVQGDSIGGLASESSGTIANSSSSAILSGCRSLAGGLVGTNTGLILTSFATGSVACPGKASVGGLVGETYNPDASIFVTRIQNSYATGSVSTTNSYHVGGLVGFKEAEALIGASYSTGAPTQDGNNSKLGGLIGVDHYTTKAEVSDSYWDTSTSGITNLSQGAEEPPNAPGITGLTTSQLQSGLPAGFSPSVWAENPGINGGLPYLIANPPPQ